MSAQEPLLRNLGLKEASALVVGTIIGTGVFIKTAVMSQQAGAPLWVLAAWAAAGALSFAGALTYAELGALFPRAGGEYVYMKEAYGPLAGFLYGWTRFWIASPGTIAAYGVGAATFAAGFLPLGAHRTAAAVALIAVFTGLNCLSVAFGGKVQSAMTALKIVMIAGLSGALLLFDSDGTLSRVTDAAAGGFKGWSLFGAAVLSALWAFDGWNNLPMAAGEIKEPGRVLPLALGLGMLVVLILYSAANLAYFYALPFSDILASYSTAHPDALPVAARAVQGFGEGAARLLSAAFVFSALGAMNGSILTGARVPYAMACDGLFFKQLGQVSAGTRVPVVSVLIQGALSCVLAVSGTFDQLTDYVVFASWIFYAACTASLFVFRRKLPDAERPYRAPGYPYVPAVFLACSALLLVNTVVSSPKESAVGLGLIAAGLPCYAWFKRG
jgi:APA family basic amino acid/polyamine antiporter